MDLWNKRDLQGPPITTYYTAKCNINLKLFRKTTKKACEFYENQEHLHKEAALLSRCIYRMKMKFRSCKDFKMLEKLNRIVLSYLKLDIASTMKSVFELIPNKAHPLGLYLPTKNVVDYVLVKLQGLAKLMARLVETSLLCLQYFTDRIQVGHFWNLAVIGMGLISRFNAVGRNILLNTCELFHKLQPFSGQLENASDFCWLPVGYKFPKNIITWLNIPWFSESGGMVEVINKPNIPLIADDDISELIDSDESD